MRRKVPRTLAAYSVLARAGAYLRDLQGILSVAAVVWVIALVVKHRRPALWPVATIVAINLAVNLGYFLSHPVFTQYYLMPLAMLSLWTLLFAYVLDDVARMERSEIRESRFS